MKLPAFLTRWLAQKPAPSMASAARALAQHRHAQERNRIIDVANEMAARQGKAPIKRRPV